MALYIQAPQSLAQRLGLTQVRNRMPDGTWLLWQADMATLGPITQLPLLCARYGCNLLQPSEARLMQDGRLALPLPLPEEEDGTTAQPTASEETAPASEEEEDRP